ncbi:RNaseH domain-containing protein [Streptomyces sp. NPDC001250]|uniref:RNaseH domain-containing protein n=1 Tax=unclassified Streptomyces TaxID=2593676 RepID=UPI0033334B71
MIGKGSLPVPAGVVHPRLTPSISTGNGLKERVAHLGLHMRAQLGDRHVNRTEEPKLMWVLTAFVPVGERWKALVYLPTDRGGSGGWFNCARAQALSRSHPIPEGSRGDDTLPRRIDHALYELSRHLKSGYVLYVSGDSTRPVWPLLANKNADLLPDDGLAHGRPAVPGTTLAPEHLPRTVIRTTSSADPSIPLPALFHEIDEDRTVSDGDKGLPGNKSWLPAAGLVALVWGDRRGSRPSWLRSSRCCCRIWTSVSVGWS